MLTLQCSENKLNFRVSNTQFIIFFFCFIFFEGNFKAGIIREERVKPEQETKTIIRQ